MLWLNKTLEFDWRGGGYWSSAPCWTHCTCCGCQSLVGKARCDPHWCVHVWLSHWGNSHAIAERGSWLSLDWRLIQFLSWSNRTQAHSGHSAAGWAVLLLRPDSWTKTAWRCRRVSSSDLWPISAWEHRRATTCVSRVFNIRMSDKRFIILR